MKVSELAGTQLDYWVARADEQEIRQAGKAIWVVNNGFSAYIGGDHVPQYAPSTDWSYGGPVIERKNMYLEYDADDYWVAHTKNSKTMSGPTALVAAMRALVQWKFGDEVEETT